MMRMIFCLLAISCVSAADDETHVIIEAKDKTFFIMLSKDKEAAQTVKPEMIINDSVRSGQEKYRITVDSIGFGKRFLIPIEKMTVKVDGDKLLDAKLGERLVIPLSDLSVADEHPFAGRFDTDIETVYSFLKFVISKDSIDISVDLSIAQN